MQHDVQAVQDFIQVIDVVHLRAKRRAHRCHDERRRHAFAGNVRDNQPDIFVRQRDEIIEIPPQRVAGDVSRRQVDAGDDRRIPLRRVRIAPPADRSARRT